jgi:hypothetical protein
MDLSAYSGSEVEAALLRAGCDPTTPDLVAASCGESLAELWMRRGAIDAAALESLPPAARAEAVALLRARAQSLLPEPAPSWMADTGRVDDWRAILPPCLVAVPHGLLRVPGSDLRHFVRGRTPAGHWKFRHGATASMRVSFLIQRDGGLREIRPLGAQRRWAAAFARLYDVVLLECEVARARQLTHGELLAHLQGVAAKPPFDVAGKLRKFLRALPESECFDERRFRAFWDAAGPALPPGAWTEIHTGR